MNELKVGDPVLLTLDSPGIAGITRGLEKYKDRRFRISRVVKVANDNKQMYCYYELERCVSEKGIPYGVTSDWLSPVREVRK